MSISRQDWQSVESRQGLTEPKRWVGPVAYLAFLVILAAYAAFMTIFWSIGSAS